MIIVCAGDSFTAGAELWEEKNIPGYAQAKTQKEAAELSVKFENNRKYIFEQALIKYDAEYIDEYTNLVRYGIDNQSILTSVQCLRNKLAIDKANLVQQADVIGAKLKLIFSNHLAEKLNCQVVNLGKNGSSEIDTIQRTIKTLKQIKETTQDKIVCILQHTGYDRVWLGAQEENKSIILAHIENHVDDAFDVMHIKSVYMKYISDELLQLEYLNFILGIQRYCLLNDIIFIHLDSYLLPIHKNNVNISEIFYDSEFYIGNMIDYLSKQFGNNNFYLVGGHVNCESHEVIADWLIEEMKKRDII